MSTSFASPPTRHALDFLDAPKNLTRFLDHRLYRILTAPTRGVMKAVNKAATSFIRQVTKVVGAEVFDDAIAFFQAFDGMETGFRKRADEVMALLRSSAPASTFSIAASSRSSITALAVCTESTCASASLGRDAARSA